MAGDVERPPVGGRREWSFAAARCDRGSPSNGPGTGQIEAARTVRLSRDLCGGVRGASRPWGALRSAVDHSTHQLTDDAEKIDSRRRSFLGPLSRIFTSLARFLALSQRPKRARTSRPKERAFHRHFCPAPSKTHFETPSRRTGRGLIPRTLSSGRSHPRRHDGGRQGTFFPRFFQPPPKAQMTPARPLHQAAPHRPRQAVADEAIPQSIRPLVQV